MYFMHDQLSDAVLHPKPHQHGDEASDIVIIYYFIIYFFICDHSFLDIEVTIGITQPGYDDW